MSTESTPAHPSARIPDGWVYESMLGRPYTRKEVRRAASVLPNGCTIQDPAGLLQFCPPIGAWWCQQRSSNFLVEPQLPGWAGAWNVKLARLHECFGLSASEAFLCGFVQHGASNLLAIVHHCRPDPFAGLGVLGSESPSPAWKTNSLKETWKTRSASDWWFGCRGAAVPLAWSLHKLGVAACEWWRCWPRRLVLRYLLWVWTRCSQATPLAWQQVSGLLRLTSQPGAAFEARGKGLAGQSKCKPYALIGQHGADESQRREWWELVDNNGYFAGASFVETLILKWAGAIWRPFLQFDKSLQIVDCQKMCKIKKIVQLTQAPANDQR